jgi:hypothetical protein
MNCSPGDIAKITLVGVNFGRMVTVSRAPADGDHETPGCWHLHNGAGPCWVVAPLQALWVESPEFMPHQTLVDCIVPDAWLMPIQGEPIADDVTVETPVAVAA